MSDETMRFGDRRKRNRLFLGFLLILAGGLLLLQRFTNFDFTNWWALFILIPAFGAFSSAWIMFQNSGRFTEGVRSSLGGGLVVLTVALIFLLNLDWSVWWPLMVLVPGFSMFMSGFTIPGSREAERPFAQRLHRPWLGWTGLGVMLLGAGFLADGLNLYNPALIAQNWWALPIFVPAVGGVFTALRLLFTGAGFGWAAISNLVTTAIFAVVGVVAYAGLDWNLLTPILIIAIGLVLLVGVFRR